MPGRRARRRMAVASMLVVAATVLLVIGCGSARREGEHLAGARAPGVLLAPSHDIAFSFGGRIYAMRPDGSRRVRLTGGPFPREMGLDDEPAWSPDGTRLAFVRRDPQSETSRSLIYLLPADGGPPRPLTMTGDASSPAWSPDGRLIAFVRRTDEERAIVVAEGDGSIERVLWSEREDPGDHVFIDAPAWSPDGSRIAFTRTTLDRRHTFRPSLYVMDADGGDVRLLSRDARNAAWSPDGRRIAFAGVRDRNGKRCWDQCQLLAELYAMDADGTDQVRLTRNRGDDDAPAWSPDGRRIAFASDRNYPRGGNQEIYTIRPDGSCLAWLTNGTPESGDPAWRNAPHHSTRPDACRAIRRGPQVDVDTREARTIDKHQRVYWLGTRHGDLLLSDLDVSRDGRSFHSVFLHYDDCAQLHPRRCPPSLQLQEVSVCSRWGSSTLGVVNEPEWGRRVRALAARGLLLVDIGDGDLGVVAGATHVRLFPGVGGAQGRRQLLDAVTHLRQIRRPRAPLPPPTLPRGVLRPLWRTERAYARLGSVDAVARSMGTPRNLVSLRLRFARAVGSLPRVRAITCPRR